MVRFWVSTEWKQIKIYKDFCYSYFTKSLDVINKFARQNLAIVIYKLKWTKLNIFLYYYELFKIQSCKTEIMVSVKNISYVIKNHIMSKVRRNEKSKQN